MKLPPFPRSKSRKVNGFVKAELKRRFVAFTLMGATADAHQRRGALTGGQYGEAQRLLEIADPDTRQLKLKEEEK